MLNILIKDTVTYEQDEVEGESPTPAFNGRLPPPAVVPLAKSKSEDASPGLRRLI